MAVALKEKGSKTFAAITSYPYPPTFINVRGWGEYFLQEVQMTKKSKAGSFLGFLVLVLIVLIFFPVLFGIGVVFSVLFGAVGMALKG
jgi:hypothetical protein